jgi:site-specific recombinase XerC
MAERSAPSNIFRLVLAPEGERPPYARLVREWATGIGLQAEDYGTHSLRRTKASIVCKATGNLRAVQILLGHAKIESTVRYLGVDVEDALEFSERTEI